MWHSAGNAYATTFYGDKESIQQDPASKSPEVRPVLQTSTSPSVPAARIKDDGYVLKTGDGNKCMPLRAVGIASAAQGELPTPLPILAVCSSFFGYSVGSSHGHHRDLNSPRGYAAQARENQSPNACRLRQASRSSGHRS